MAVSVSSVAKKLSAQVLSPGIPTREKLCLTP
jgi:hypothetical protein